MKRERERERERASFIKGIGRAAAAVALSSGLLLGAGIPAQAKPITLRVAYTAQPDCVIAHSYEVFKQELEKRTDGKVRVILYPNAQLGNDVATAEAVAKGALDVASCGANNISPFTKLYYWADLPFMFRDITDVYKVYGGPVGKELKAKMLEQTPFKVLFYADTGSFRHLMNTKHPVRTPDDVRHLKFRTTPSPVETAVVESLGGVPTPIQHSEIYMAMEQGVVEAEMQQYMWSVGTRRYQLTKYITELPAQHALHLAVMNKDKFASYPPEIRTAIDEAAAAAEAYNFANAPRANEELRQLVMKSGCQIITLTPEEIEPFRQRAMKVWDAYKDEVDMELVSRVQAVQQ